MADSDELADESFAIDPLDPILARDQAEVLMAEVTLFASPSL